MKQLSALLVSIFAAACGSSAAPAPDAPPAATRAVIVAGDFTSTGVLSTFDPATREVKMNVGPPMAVGNDPVLRHGGNELFIINRAENNITILDDQTFALKEQLGTGADSSICRPTRPTARRSATRRSPSAPTSTCRAS
jgi:hypothetical protein